MIHRVMGYVINPLKVQYRVRRGLEQHHEVAGIALTLPPNHNLPFYQQRDETYDVYAVPLLAALASGIQTLTVIDVGANVGDTAAIVLGAHPKAQVVSVEGSEAFLPYLEKNLAPYADRATIVPGFVGPVGNGSNMAFDQQGSTGGFRYAPVSDHIALQEWVSPQELLAMPDEDDLVVWKSDIDGFDIHVLADHWDDIAARCDVLWFEFDSPRTMGNRADIDELVARLADSDRMVLVYDNLGRLIVHLQPDGVDGLLTLSQWLHQQRAGHVAVPYLDIWAITPHALGLMDSGN